jgi:hypothetical protein
MSKARPGTGVPLARWFRFSPRFGEQFGDLFFADANRAADFVVGDLSRFHQLVDF